MPQRAEVGPNGYPVVQGINLVPTSSLPDRIRSVFKYPLLNVVQSKCFDNVYNSNDNFVLSAPTGSGKTTILELAICRLITTSEPHAFKVIYQAPTKALCTERHKDWSTRFRHLDIKVAEITGDSEIYQLKAIANADIIVSTPEKWDSMTRKWKDYKKFMELVKLFLIDEVHILKEERGASLEAVVSRMKSVGSEVRFVALSATVPNSNDIATWLGKNSRTPQQPARREVFGEEFRPVKLTKYVVGLKDHANVFAFDTACTDKLPDIIAEYGTERKPMMIFCFTRKSCEGTAAMLANWWASSRPQHQFWSGPQKQVNVRDPQLRKYMSAGVAYHHAGISNEDRAAVEQAYLEGNVNVICCTSTLAVGVNLPCHLVIIKNTMAYGQTGASEYSDLEVMQMLGRAGRPQFDKSAVAVIITMASKVNHYENMVSGNEVLESKLHLNLIEHMNAEVGLGTIYDRATARQWLKGTFFYVRLGQNLQYYQTTAKLAGNSVTEITESLCEYNLKMLHKYYLITGAGAQNIMSTEYGHAMARYYVPFDTMKLFMALGSKAKISEILSALAQASEFSQLRLKSGERAMFKEINSSPCIKFPIQVDLAVPAQKVSLIIQATLGGLDTRNDDRFRGHSTQLHAEATLIFEVINRLIRCIIDCQIQNADSVATRNALELSRSLAARAWDDSPLQLLQVKQIGPVAVRKLANQSIRSIEELEATEAYRIEGILTRNPPFGLQVLAELKSFPKLRVAVKMIGQPRSTSTGKGRRLRIHLKAELGFVNETPPTQYRQKPIYICMLAETSPDGHLLHFCRLSAQKVGNGFEVQFQADLASPQQFINCYVACDDLAGTQRTATLKPAIASGLFPKITDMEEDRPVLSRVSPYPSAEPRGRSRDQSEAFDDELDDADLAAVAAGDDEFEDIDDVVESLPTLAGSGKPRKSGVASTHRSNDLDRNTSLDNYVPKQLPNSKWECKHPCVDKKSCKHPCCQDGLDKPPKPPKPKKPKQAKDDEKNTTSEKAVSSKSTKTKKPLVVVHTDPFTASKKSSSSTKQSKLPNLPPVKRPRSNDTDFGGDDIDFDDIIADVPALTLDRFSGLSTFRPSNEASGDVAKSEGLFLTSSPEKQTKWEEIDLSSDAHDGRAMAPHSTKRPHITPVAAPQQVTKKARLHPSTTQNLSRAPPQQDSQRFVALSDLEYDQSSFLPRSKLPTSHRPPSRHGLASKSPYDLSPDATIDVNMDIDTAPIVHAAFTATGVTFRADAAGDASVPVDEDNDFDLEFEDDEMRGQIPLKERTQYGIHMNPSPGTSFNGGTVQDSDLNVNRDEEDEENGTLSQDNPMSETEKVVEADCAQENGGHDSYDDGDSAVAVKEEEKEEKEDPEFTQWMAGMEEFVEIV